MSLMEKEIEKRKRNSFKSKMSKSFDLAKSKVKNKFNEVQAQQKEQKNFNTKLKTIEKRSYRRSLQSEAKRAGRIKARTKYRSKKSMISKIGSFTSSTPGFMEMPGNNKKKKKNDDAFSLF